MKKKIIFIFFINLLFFCGFIQIKAYAYEYIQCFYEIGPGVYDDNKSDENTIVEFRIDRGPNAKDWDPLIVINGQSYKPVGPLVVGENMKSYGSGDVGYINVPIPDCNNGKCQGYNFPDDYNLVFTYEIIQQMKENMRQGGDCDQVLYVYQKVKAMLIEETQETDERQALNTLQDPYLVGEHSSLLQEHMDAEAQERYIKAIKPVLSYVDPSNDDINSHKFKTYEEAKKSKENGEEKPESKVTSTDNTCSYNFGTNISDDLTDADKKTLCNFTVDSKWTQTLTQRSDQEDDVVTKNDYVLNILERFSSTEVNLGIGSAEDKNELKDIRPYNHAYGSLTLSFNKSIATKVHKSEAPGSCLDGSEVFAYYDGSGYVLTLSSVIAEAESKLGYYCDGSGNLIAIEGASVSGCDVVPEVVRKWIKIVLNFVKYVALVLVIVLGTIDFIKAAAQGEPDSMKKAGQAFLKRVVAVILLFLLPMLVEFILNLINLYGSTGDCFGIYE